jgi:choline dehydrogenase-like flavoprotein
LISLNDNKWQCKEKPLDFQLPWQQPSWRCTDARNIIEDKLMADVVVVGSGAGGAVAASVLAQSGLKVIILEAGPLKTAKDFTMEELPAYRDLYQSAGSQATKDGSIRLFQGRAVGGTTLVNWTSNFRTPLQTLRHWQEQWDFDTYPQAMALYFERIEQRLGIAPWQVTPNANNAILQQGCERLGLHFGQIPRNVKSCWNLGFCGMGCPTNAKQSMLVTYIPEALNHGAHLIYHAQVDQLLHKNNLINSVMINTSQPNAQAFSIQAKHVVLAAGAIRSPGILQRSQAPDPYQRLGKRTFLHPVVASIGLFNDPIEPYYGAPQSVYSDAYLWPSDEARMGFKLEVPPIHPGLAAQMLGTHGKTLESYLAQLPNIHACIALLRDGFHNNSQGGQVILNQNLNPILEYDISDDLWNGFIRAYAAMAEIQFAAGAKAVLPLHQDAKQYWHYAQAKKAIQALPKKRHRARLMSAHIMGGCGASQDPAKGVVNSFGRHHQLRNCSVIDGSIFPTSVGANPQLSIYAYALKNSERLAFELTH